MIFFMMIFWKLLITGCCYTNTIYSSHHNPLTPPKQETRANWITKWIDGLRPAAQINPALAPSQSPAHANNAQVDVQIEAAHAFRKATYLNDLPEISQTLQSDPPDNSPPIANTLYLNPAQTHYFCVYDNCNLCDFWVLKFERHPNKALSPLKDKKRFTSLSEARKYIMLHIDPPSCC